MCFFKFHKFAFSDKPLWSQQESRPANIPCYEQGKAFEPIETATTEEEAQPKPILSWVVLKNSTKFTSVQSITEIENEIALMRIHGVGFVRIQVARQYAMASLKAKPKTISVLISEILYIEEL